MASVANDDPLLPWLRSIRQVKQAHAEDKSKILPHVSACYQEFRDSVRYRNDPRFLRVCVQLADCSPDPLKIMTELDERGIGHTHALFYEAYATCLEAKRRFGDANNVYKRGLASQAQPTDKLINSYKIFRDRMDVRKKRKQDQMEEHGRKEHGRKSINIAQEGLPRHSGFGDIGTRHMEACQGGAELASRSHLVASNLYTAEGLDISFEELRLANACKFITSNNEQDEGSRAPVLKPLTSQNVSIAGSLGSGSFGEETIQIRNFAAGVITGKEKDVEDARHHGLVDPTINTKEALQDILSMFRKPLDVAKKDMSKPSNRLVSISVASSPPLLQRKMVSPKGGKPIQPLEFLVFKDDEQSEPQFKPSSKPVAVFPLLRDKNKNPRSPLGSLQAQPVEFCVFKDDEEEQVQPHSQVTSAGLSDCSHEGKKQSSSLLGGLQARPIEFSVFKDDELEENQIEPRSTLSEKGKSSLFVSAHSDKGSKPPWVAKSEEDSHTSSFFIFKDEEPSEEGEEANALNVYRDKENMEYKAQSSKSTASKQADSEFFVFKDDSIGSTLQKQSARLFCHDGEANLSKGKCLGVNKMLGCGIENMIPQSPLYQP